MPTSQNVVHPEIELRGRVEPVGIHAQIVADKGRRIGRGLARVIGDKRTAPAELHKLAR